MDAPVALYAAQVHKESSWRDDAESPYAQGLTQFTPDTANWAAQRWQSLRPANVWSPGWALRAMILYDGFLRERVGGANECAAWSLTLSAYNGGLTNTRRDVKLAELRGANPRLWWGHVERYSARAEWAYRENRNYPRRILELQETYAAWGGGVVQCDDRGPPVQQAR